MLGRPDDFRILEGLVPASEIVLKDWIVPTALKRKGRPIFRSRSSMQCVSKHHQAGRLASIDDIVANRHQRSLSNLEPLATDGIDPPSPCLRQPFLQHLRGSLKVLTGTGVQRIPGFNRRAGSLDKDSYGSTSPAQEREQRPLCSRGVVPARHAPEVLTDDERRL